MIAISPALLRSQQPDLESVLVQVGAIPQNDSRRSKVQHDNHTSSSTIRSGKTFTTTVNPTPNDDDDDDSS